VVRSVSITVNKAAGADVNIPNITWNPVTTYITVTPVAPPDNGQKVEYAIGTTSAAPAGGWQDGTTFSGLLPDTTYYIFARSKENDNYNAGTASISAAVTFYTVTFESNGGSTVTAQNVVSGGKANKPADPARSGHVFDGWYKEKDLTNIWNFAADSVSKSITLYAKWVLSYGLTLTFEQISEGAPTPTVPAMVISHKGTNGRPKETTISVSTPSQYDSITWVIPAYGDGLTEETDSSITLDSMDFMVGKHYITLEVWKDGKPYSRIISFEVVE